MHLFNLRNAHKILIVQVHSIHRVYIHLFFPNPNAENSCHMILFHNSLKAMEDGLGP